MQHIDITKFLGLKNTVSEARQPIGALTHADNVLIDNSGAVARRKGCVKIANGNITSSYGTRDNSMIYLIDDESLYRFDGESFFLIDTGFGDGTVHWAEESASLIFVKSDLRFVAVLNGSDVIDLNVPAITDATITQGAGQLPEMSVGLTAQYVNKLTGLRGALCPHQIIGVSAGSSLLVTVPPIANHYVSIYGSLPDSGAWSEIGQTENFLVITDYPNTHIPADYLYFDVTSVPADIAGMTYHAGRLAVATIQDDKTTLIQFSVPNLYHLFDAINDSFSIPDLITSMISVHGQLLITGMRSIHVFSENGLQRIANFGTPIGKPIQLMPDGSVMIWTMRGVCKFPEFQNLTENDFSVPSGFGCMTALLEQDGSKFLTIATDDLGEPYNASFSI